ncbi:hypothetical protein [Streptomyces sp. NBC_01497]|uniref:hypothetical protein n=1 Tax=Streptomyces sp. NBC_01497 TaxID=2903885 RepID=UPI002E33510F|nr:hypothetical protein [Streptomyces sp. NBC_01497]
MALGDAGATPPGGGTAAAERTGGAARLRGGERLPCGRLVGEVWERARDSTGPPDTHAAGCPYCRRTVAELAALDTAVQALRAARPGGTTVADRVMRAVRAEGRLGRLLPLDDPGRDLRIAETAAAAVLRRAADGVPGVRAASCRLVPGADGARQVDIAMTLAVALDAPLPARAARARRAVASAARQHIGIVPGRIDLRIVSVLEPVELPATAVPAHPPHPSHPARPWRPTHPGGGTP